MAYTPKMPRKRSRRKKKKDELTVLDWVKIVLFVVVSAALVSVFIFLKADIGNVADDYGRQASDLNGGKANSKSQFNKQFEYANEKKQEENQLTNQNGNKGSSSHTTSSDKIGNYSIDYYVMFPVYEGTMVSINSSDGGFGPIQETHSGLPETLEKMYAWDTDFFSWLKPFIDDPSSYMYRCEVPHKWPNRFNDGQGGKTSTSGCVSYKQGSEKIKEAVLQNITTPEDTKTFYDAFMEVNEPTYLEPAISKLTDITGRDIEDIGPGTVATLFAIYVRWGVKSNATNGCTASMTDDELIDQMQANARAKSDESRWTCATSIAKAMNAGTIDIYGYYNCDKSCGNSHGVPAGKSFGELFGGN